MEKSSIILTMDENFIRRSVFLKMVFHRFWSILAKSGNFLEHNVMDDNSTHGIIFDPSKSALDEKIHSINESVIHG